MNRKLVCLLIICLGIASGGLSAETKTSAAALDKLASLKGEWEGTFAWSGARTSTGKMDAQYYVTGNASAVVENLMQDGTPVMTSVYHLDGGDLRLTHFCGAQNQPRLRATDVDPDNGITFSFVDITNLRSPTAGHVDGLEVRFLASDHITLKFRFKGDNKESDELIDLKRKK
jgi:hypothetical protein